MLSGGILAEGARKPVSRLDHRLDQALLWDVCLRNWGRTPPEFDREPFPHWMLSALLTVASVRNEIEREAHERE